MVVDLKRFGLGAGGLLTLPIKVFNFNGVGMEATTVLMGSFGLVMGFDGYLYAVYGCKYKKWLICWFVKCYMVVASFYG